MIVAALTLFLTVLVVALYLAGAAFYMVTAEAADAERQELGPRALTSALATALFWPLAATAASLWHGAHSALRTRTTPDRQPR